MFFLEGGLGGIGGGVLGGGVWSFGDGFFFVLFWSIDLVVGIVMISLVGLEYSSIFFVIIIMLSGIFLFIILFCFFVLYFLLVVLFFVDSYLYFFRVRIGVLGGINGKDFFLFELLVLFKYFGDVVTGELYLGVDLGEDRGEFLGVWFCLLFLFVMLWCNLCISFLDKLKSFEILDIFFFKDFIDVLFSIDNMSCKFFIMDFKWIENLVINKKIFLVMRLIFEWEFLISFIIKRVMVSSFLGEVIVFFFENLVFFSIDFLLSDFFFGGFFGDNLFWNFLKNFFKRYSFFKSYCYEIVFELKFFVVYRII